MKNFVLVILSIITFSKCNSNTEAPKRLENIPLEAQWYGGADGGAWITVQESEMTNTFTIKIYNEFNGSLWTEGLFKISDNCSNKLFTKEDITKNINAFDGTRIFLTQSQNGKYCSLEPIK